jgi:phospholipid-binding lipoprotein MlaA
LKLILNKNNYYSLLVLIKPFIGSPGSKNLKTSLILFLFFLGLSSCATTQETTEQPNNTKVSDPYEKVNREIYDFNNGVDQYVAKPVADAYTWATPQVFRTGVRNFFNNLKNVNVVFNDILQAKFEQSAKDAGRFAINSTIGLGGLVDVADDVGLKQGDEDFDQTLAVWGVPPGSYMVLPILGPTTPRGITGVIVDTLTSPATYVGVPVKIITSYMGAPVSVMSMLNTRANAEGSLQFINEAALDKYVFTRESFLQWRENLASDGKSSNKSDFEDELFNDDKNKAGQKIPTTEPPNLATRKKTPGTNTRKLELLPVTQ